MINLNTPYFSSAVTQFLVSPPSVNWAVPQARSHPWTWVTNRSPPGIPGVPGGAWIPPCQRPPRTVMSPDLRPSSVQRTPTGRPCQRKRSRSQRNGVYWLFHWCNPWTQPNYKHNLCCMLLANYQFKPNLKQNENIFGYIFFHSIVLRKRNTNFSLLFFFFTKFMPFLFPFNI